MSAHGGAIGAGDPPGEPDDGLLYDVISTLTTNAKRVAVAAAAETESAGDPDVTGYVIAALDTETRAILAGLDPRNVELIGAVNAAAHAIEAVVRQALRTSVQEPVPALERAFDLFTSYINGPGRTQILGRDA